MLRVLRKRRGVEKQEEQTKSTRSTLRKLYSVAEPLIEKLPGRDIEEKRVVFNSVLLICILLYYVSPLPSWAIRNFLTPHGVLLTLLTLVALPIFVFRYARDVIHYYTERVKSLRKQQR